jgi:GNAT superfamily N-acetyltransferase
MAPHIRPARPGEAGLILSLVRELAEYEKLAHTVDATEAMIAEWGGEIAGFALWFTNFSTFRGRAGLYLEDLFVRPAFRGRGIGRALLARLAGGCETRGFARMEWVVLDWNRPAIDFYRSLGAKIAGDWRLARLDGAALRALAGE